MNDHRTVFGRTLASLLQEMDLKSAHPSCLRSAAVKRTLKYWSVPCEETWRVSICKELLDVQTSDTTIPGFTLEECKSILTHICVT